MPYFSEWRGLSVYSGKVKTHKPSKDTISFFNLENIKKLLNFTKDGNEISLDSIKTEYPVRYALIYVLNNLISKFDRNLSGYLRSNEPINLVAKNELRMQRMFNSEFILIYLNPNVYKDFGSSNSFSYYHLFLSLLNSVNSVLLDRNDHTLSKLRVSCENIDFCLSSTVSDSYIKEILAFYKKTGAVDFSEDYVFSFKDVRGVFLLDKNKLRYIGDTSSHIGFSFSPSGFLMPYHLGVLSFLCEYNSINCTVPLAGASSGSLSICSSVVVNGFINCMNIVEKASNRLRAQKNKGSDDKSKKDSKSEDSKQRESLDDIVRVTSSELLKEGSHLYINDRIGSLTVAYSVMRRMKFRCMLNSHFLSVPDLIDCLRVSSYIPMVSSKEVVYYKGEAGYDGQLSLNKTVGCPPTSAKRTIRINPYNFSSGKISKQVILNEYITPHLSTNDQYLMYYVRLKSIIYQLNLRRLTLKGINVEYEFKNELIDAINLYNIITEPPTFKFVRPKVRNFSEIREYNKLSALWNSQAMVDLFLLVATSESTMDIDKYNVKKYEVTPNMDIINTLGYSKLFKKPISTSPFNLLTYLYLQLSQFADSQITEEPLDEISSFISHYGSIYNSDESDRSDLTVLNLVNLLNLLVPPFVLIYNYCFCNGLIFNNVPKKTMLNISLFSSDDHQLRFFYDLGKTDAFRWIIMEYIKFENYVYLKILQLVKFKDDSNFNKAESIDFNSFDVDSLIHNRQTSLISNNLNLLHKDKFTHQTTSDSVHYKLFLQLNNAVRSVIMENTIDSHFSHILSHSHFWDYNKHYRF